MLKPTILFTILRQCVLVKQACVTKSRHQSDLKHQLTVASKVPLRNVVVCPDDTDRPRFAFDYENLEHPQFKQLRDQYPLDQIVEKSHSDYDRAWDLANWMRCQFGYGDPENSISRRFDAIEILTRGQAGERFRCGSISGAFIQCLLALGIQARLLNLENPQGQAHVVVEVWCGELGHWVIFDVDNNIGYCIDQHPASAYDLHMLWVTSMWKRAELICGPHIDFKPADINAFNKVDFYWHFSVKMRNDWFSTDYPFWHPKGNALLGDLEWQDEKTPPRTDRAWVTGRQTDLYWSVDQVQVLVMGAGENPCHFNLQFKCHMPDISCYHVEAKGEKFTLREPEYTWSLQTGHNLFRVCAEQALGRLGPETSISLEVL